MHNHTRRRHYHTVPCLCCHPRSYIRLVQHLIERCLMFRMSREECVKALEERVGIRPLVTLTVWRELLKENRDFFRAYFEAISSRQFTGNYVGTSGAYDMTQEEDTGRPDRLGNWPGNHFFRSKGGL